MASPATPGELGRLIDFLEPVDPRRHAAIARMVFHQVAVCPICGYPVRRCDPRRLVDDRLAHVNCLEGDRG